MKRVIILLALMFIGSLATGCTEETPSPGSIRVKYTIGLSFNCAEYNLKEIEIIVAENNVDEDLSSTELMRFDVNNIDNEKYVIAADTVNCSDSGAATINSIPVDTYKILVFGFTEDGSKAYWGISESVEVISGAEISTNEIEMDDIPASLYISWYIGRMGTDGKISTTDAGIPYKCRDLDITNVWVRLYRKNPPGYVTINANQNVMSCTSQEVLVANLSAGAYEVEVMPATIDANGEPQEMSGYENAQDLDGTAVEEFELSPGEEGQINIFIYQ